MGTQIEGQQKVFCYTNNIAHNAWTSLTSSDFKSMTTGYSADARKGFAEVSFLNTGATRLYISFGYEPTVNAAGNEAANAALLQAQAIELSAGSFLHIELTGTEVSKISVRTSDPDTTGAIQTHAILLY